MGHGVFRPFLLLNVKKNRRKYNKSNEETMTFTEWASIVDNVHNRR